MDAKAPAVVALTAQKLDSAAHFRLRPRLTEK